MWAGQQQVLPGSTYAPTLYPLGDNIEAWAAAVLKLAKGDRLIAVGCSVGGSCALELAVAAPDRIAALVLIGTKAGHRYDLLGHSLSGEIVVEPYLITLRKDAVSYTSFRHAGVEFLYMLSGKVRYRHADRTYLMEPGDALFFDASPGPAKYAMAKLHNWLTDEVRLPIVPPSSAACAAIDAALAHAGLLVTA